KNRPRNASASPQQPIPKRPPARHSALSRSGSSQRPAQNLTKAKNKLLGKKIDLPAPLASRFKQLTELIIAPCCWTQPISTHSSKASSAIQQDIKKRLLLGQTNAQIQAAYVKQFGDKILAIPPDGEIVFLPILVSILALLAVFGLIHSWSRKQSRSITPSSKVAPT
ncbi:MAG: cytochrome c-type biogenesis protein CcmH, partial [Myxococcota bacterium]